MANRIPRILLTGDYWDADFQGLIASSACVTTLVPDDKVTELNLQAADYDLVVIAAARRNQVSSEWVESLRSSIAPTPVVALLGSWCEGELRSGKPWPGVKRVYWHQWRGRFDQFVSRLNNLQISAWQLPETASDADTIRQVCDVGLDLNAGASWTIGISSLTEQAFLMLDDALRAIGSETCWVERQQWDATEVGQLSAVCLEADSWNESVNARVQWLRDDLEIEVPIVLLLNFPRRDDVQDAKAAGVFDVVSKPFQLTDIAAVIARSAQQSI